MILITIYDLMLFPTPRDNAELDMGHGTTLEAGSYLPAT